MSKVIIAEDESQIGDFIYGCVDWKALGISEIYRCTNGEDALLYLEKGDTDIVLTDINMPKTDGLELLKRARILYRNVKFVIISGYDDFHLVKEAFKLGATDYVLKSELQAPELKKIVENMLKTPENEEPSDMRNTYLLKEQSLKEFIWSMKPLKTDGGLKFRIQPDKLCAAAFRAVNFEEILNENWKGDRELLKYGLSNIINELLDNFGFGEFVFGSGDETVFLFSLSDGRTKADIKEAVSIIAKQLAQYFGFKFRIGICAKENETARNLYVCADDAARYSFVTGEGVNDYEEIAEQKDAKFPSVSGLLKNFEKYVLNFNFSPILENFGKYTFDTAPFSHFGELLGLYEGYFKVLSAVILQHRWISNMTLSHEEIIKSGTLFELNRHLKETLLNLKNAFSNDNSQIGKVKKYVDENYHKNITADNIAMQFYIDSRKLSREFAKTYGMSLAKYITDIRMKRAMQLITTSDFLLYEIAEMVGYMNYESFSRTFYSYWGQWPKNVKSQGGGK